jgi:hypothetical protein
MLEDGRGHVKVGVSDDLLRRLQNLQTGDADEHVLRMAVLVGCRELEHRLEFNFHTVFAAHRCPGGREWYDDSPAIRAWCFAVAAGRRCLPVPGDEPNE